MAMNFSVEVWKRSFQRLGGLPGKDDESDEVTVEQRVRALETRLTHKEAEVLGLERKLLALEGKLGAKEEQLENLARESKGKIHRIKQVVKELEEKKAGWINKEEIFVTEMQELASLLEDKSAALNAATVETRIEKERCRAMEMSLKEKIEELRCCRDARDAFQVNLNSCQDGLKSLQEESDRKIKDLKEKLSISHFQSNEAAHQLKIKTEEMELMMKDLDSKEVQLASIKGEAQHLRGKSSDLEFTVETQQGKISKLLEELHESEVKSQQLCNSLAAAESELASSKEVISNLQLKLELGNQLSGQLEEANAKIKELESMLTDLVAFSQEKDEKLDASEWAVKQLGLFEISKAKASLAEAERDHVQLKHRCSHLERKLKSKEEELVDVDHYVECLQKQLKNEEAERQKLKENLLLVVGMYECLKAEHDTALLSIDGYRSQVQFHKEKRSLLEQFIDKLKSAVVTSQQEVALTNNKLKEVRSELQNTQLGSKDLIQQMLLLHNNLLEEGHAMIESGKAEVKSIPAADGTVEQSLRLMPHFSSSGPFKLDIQDRASEAAEDLGTHYSVELGDPLWRESAGSEAQLEYLHREYLQRQNSTTLEQHIEFQNGKRCRDSEAKENMPNSSTSTWKQASPGGDKAQSAERTPLQLLQVPKRQRQSDA